MYPFSVGGIFLPYFFENGGCILQQTEYYQLSLWNQDDRILMETFNGNNETIDAALKAEADAREALAETVARCGNCQLWLTTYTGSGKAGATQNSVVFPSKPTLAFVIAPNGSFMPIRYGAENCLAVVDGRDYPMQNISSWNGNTVTWFNNSGNTDCQLSVAGVEYTVIALLAADQ